LYGNLPHHQPPKEPTMPAATSTARLEARITSDLHAMFKRAIEQADVMRLSLADLPPNLGKKLPRYPSVSAVRMGRLAVDQAFKGQGLGGALLADALTLAATAPSDEPS
jgi:GNAT superfamily N-acetyltransferase